MTIRKQWLLVLIVIATLSVIVNTILLGVFTDKYFRDYTKANYENHLNQIMEYSQKTLIDDKYSTSQMEIELETHLTDPITRIKLYDNDGNLIIDVIKADQFMNDMMKRMMNSQFEEVDSREISVGGEPLGTLHVTRYNSVDNSIAVQMFKISLIRNGFLSVMIVIVFSVVFGIFISKKTSADLINTAKMAQSLDVGSDIMFEDSKVKEISIIQHSLKNLKSRLKLKQRSRKNLVDELVHQTRTPLTIIKTHLEGIADKVIEVNEENIKICEDQIENLTLIISNMSSMIDAEEEYEKLNIEEFELSVLVKQIINGMKVQFDQKDIGINLNTDEKVVLKTDKYKFSQALYNVLTNAYKFTESKGSVSLDYEVSQGNLIFNIEDDGIGIRSEDSAKIFDAYYKSDNKTESSDGIGLYISKENLRKIDGDIRVESKLNCGSKFIITIPVEIK